MEKERDNSQRGKYLVFGEGLFGEGKLIVPSTRPSGPVVDSAKDWLDQLFVLGSARTAYDDHRIIIWTRPGYILSGCIDWSGLFQFGVDKLHYLL